MLDALIGQPDLDDISDLNNLFTTKLFEAASHCIPILLDSKPKSYPPYIINLINMRRELRRKKKKVILENRGVLNTEYNRYTVVLRSAIKNYTEAKWASFLGRLGPHPASSRDFWKVINRTRSPRKNMNIPTLIAGNKIYKSEEEKASLFRASLGETFTDGGHSSDFDSIFYNSVETFVSGLDFSNISYEKFTLTELNKVIKKLKDDSSPGEDGIHNRFIKNLSPNGINILLRLINMSLEVGLPHAWKSAVITMIPKKELNSSDHLDYRPISLLSCIGKVAERLVRNRLYFYLESNRLISNVQSGFRNLRGTCDNLLMVTQKVTECLNRGKKAVGIFFDISKAFDKVWHAGLIYKLIKLKVPMYLVKFIRSFLSGRTFRVKIGDTLSEPHPVTCSVPQGSVLGPLLFLAYIDDIPLSNSANTSHSVLFADDLASIFFFKRPSRTRQKIKEYLDSLVDWLFKWRLKMNVKKCCYTIFSKGSRDSSVFEFYLGGSQIPYNPSPIFLGITFDEKMCFNNHFLNLRARALKRLNIIKIFSHKSWHINSKTLINIYRALIGSIFDYSFFSAACVSETSLGLIQRIQNRAIRCIFKLNWDSSSKELFHISGILLIRERFLQLGARYVTKSILNKNPLLSLFLSEYARSWSAITARGREMSTPLCHFTFIIATAYSFINLIKLSYFIFFFFS